MKRRRAFALALGASIFAAAPALALETSTTPVLGAGSIALEERSRMIDSVDVQDGCGTSPAGGRFVVDGDPSDWAGEPTRIPGTGRYDAGEYVWTDYAYDDDGTGTFQYPGEREDLEPVEGTVGRATMLQQRYGSNAADVILLRAAADADNLYFLIELNFLNATDSTVVGLGFDLDGDSTTGFSEWPFGAGLSTPGLDLFVTAHGDCAEVTFADRSSQSIDAPGVAGAAFVDTGENTFEISIPRTLLDGAASVRLAGGAGLWDPDGATWMAVAARPGQGRNSDPTPRGAVSGQDPEVFNLLFRDDEGLTSSPSPRAFQTQNQNLTLLGGTSGPYGVDLEIARLLPGADPDPMPVRRAGEAIFTRIYRSRLEAEGTLVTGAITSTFLGRWVPYGVALPDCYETGCAAWPGARPPLVTFVHGGGGSHVATLPSSGRGVNDTGDTFARVDEKVAPVFVAPLGRGQRAPWYRGPGEVDVLEVLDDARSVYDTDQERQLLAGGSLGGYGTLRLGSLYPDLWAVVSPHCPAAYEGSLGDRFAGHFDPATQPFVVDPLVAGLRNVPVRMGVGTIDPLVPITGTRRLRDAAIAAALDLRYTEYLLGGHCTDFAELGATWAANHAKEIADALVPGRPSSPSAVTYRIDPRQFPATAGGFTEPIGVFDIRDAGVRHHGAYWVSGLRLRPAAEAAGASGNAPGGADDTFVGAIDAASHAAGGWQITPAPCGASIGAGFGTGGNPDLEPTSPTPHFWECHDRSASGAAEDVLEVATRNLEAATIDVATAGLGASFTVRITGDGAFELTLAGLITDADGPCVTGVASSGGATTVLLGAGPAVCEIDVAP